MTQLIEAETLAWRCGAEGCERRPILALYTLLGGCNVRVRGPHGRVTNITMDLTDGPINCQCPACGAWRRLELSRETGEPVEGARPGFIPRLRAAAV